MNRIACASLLLGSCITSRCRSATVIHLFSSRVGLRENHHHPSSLPVSLGWIPVDDAGYAYGTQKKRRIRMCLLRSIRYRP
ncbi:hypothetical protein BX666DRAFT_1897625 [Dichotomocladium elegans]|nr:hypothetical protein BX666DRAFT_1897625 [Dichotomocladium elegans]